MSYLEEYTVYHVYTKFIYEIYEIYEIVVLKVFMLWAPLLVCYESKSCTFSGKGDAGDQAGFWGSLNAPCDIPLWTYKNALEFISKNIKPDLIFWTGDIPAHDVWDQTRADQLQHIEITADILSKYFPDIRVYPSLGNHESSPVDR